MRIAKLLVILAMMAGTAVAGESRSIAVVGGGGMIGQRIVREALDRGHQVLVIARDPASVTLKHPRLEVAEGDVLDSAGLAKLVAGRDVLVSAVGTARAKSPDYTLYRRAAESLVTAFRSMGEGAPRLIVVGGVGSLKDIKGELLLERVPDDRRPEHLGQKAALDFYRAVKDVSWTYVSPPERIAPGKRTGTYRTALDSPVRDEKGESRISMEDYAVAVIDEVEKPAHIGRRFTVGY
jgi:putative NADH-flavin reductase